MKQILFMSVFAIVGFFGQIASAQETMITMVFDNEPAVIALQRSSGGVVPVDVKVLRVTKMMPSLGETVVSLRTCNVLGCLSDQDVTVGSDEAIVQMDLELSYAVGTDAEQVYFKPERASFSVDGVTLPVRGLRQGTAFNVVEETPSFYLEPKQKIEQTVFTRILRDAQSVTFRYDAEPGLPGLALQACFSEGCNKQRNAVIALRTAEKEPTSNGECQLNGKLIPCGALVEKAGFLAKMGLWVMGGLALVGLLVMIFWIMMLVHVSTHPIEHKAIWILGMVFLTVFVSIAYYFAVKRPYDRAQKSLVSSGVSGTAEVPASPTPPTPQP